ncbi:MAG: response regulator transcription factor [Spirochaetota bacterium]
MFDRNMRTLLLVGPDGLLREGLAKLCEQSREIMLTGIEEHLSDVAPALGALMPDFLLVASSLLAGMNDCQGLLQCVEERSVMKRVYPLVLIGKNDYALVGHYKRAGFAGFVYEQSTFFEFEQSLLALFSGGLYIPSVAAKKCPVDCLTPREMQVLQQVSMGCSSKEIAHCLGIAVSTVDVHRKRLLEKLCVHSVAELTKCALKMGLTWL